MYKFIDKDIYELRHCKKYAPIVLFIGSYHGKTCFFSEIIFT